MFFRNYIIEINVIFKRRPAASRVCFHCRNLRNCHHVYVLILDESEKNRKAIFGKRELDSVNLCRKLLGVIHYHPYIFPRKQLFKFFYQLVSGNIVFREKVEINRDAMSDLECERRASRKVEVFKTTKFSEYRF